RRREYLAAQAQMQGATAALTTASLNMEFTEIKAPLSGRIDRRLVSVGNLVQPDSTLLTTIVTRDPIDFYFDVDERLYFSYARDAMARGGSMQE
ncbi:MAG: efflux transporter periplasmic adaptor subunit, partial [Mesorhizobium sp.]